MKCNFVFALKLKMLTFLKMYFEYKIKINCIILSQIIYKYDSDENIVSMSKMMQLQQFAKSGISSIIYLN